MIRTLRSGHELLDAGGGRRLDRFGARVVDRPTSGATEPPRAPEEWSAADLRFDRSRGWTGSTDAWRIAFDGLTLELRPTESGQVGLFAEHASLWPTLRDAVPGEPGPEILNLFAYTGATTLALAREGARVTHVDAARSAVAWARRNADLSGLGDRPIRWIVDDAPTFVRREGRRGRRYAGVVLDPPAYGHGSGRSWKLDDDLGDLLDAVGSVVEPGGWLVVTAHSAGWDATRLRSAAFDVFGGPAAADGGDMNLVARSGTVLRLGCWLRVMIRS